MHLVSTVTPQLGVGYGNLAPPSGGRCQRARPLHLHPRRRRCRPL